MVGYSVTLGACQSTSFVSIELKILLLACSGFVFNAVSLGSAFLVSLVFLVLCSSKPCRK